VAVGGLQKVLLDDVTDDAGCGSSCSAPGSNDNDDVCTAEPHHIVLRNATSSGTAATATSAASFQFTDRAVAPHKDENRDDHENHEDHVSFADVYGGDASGAAGGDMGQVELSENPMHSAAPATATR
jgi:hypothetical protein